MSTLEEMYDRSKEMALTIDASVAIYASESTSTRIGRGKSHSQIIEIEFGGSVPDEKKIEFLELVNGVGDWEFVDEDDVFVGDNEGHGLVTISRDIDLEDAPSMANEFEDSHYFEHEFNS